MGKYFYPAIFSKEGKGYNVSFPDLEGCITCGDDLKDALEMAEDVLSCYICDLEIANEKIPKVSEADDIKIEKNEFVNYIICNTDSYKRKYKTVSVKKTLTIPEWLNEAAIVRNVNFSQVLQEALMQKINL